VTPCLSSDFFAYSLRVALQAFNHFVDLTQFARDADVLRAMGLALPTLDTMVGLAVARYHTIE
jgi:hypothetical protein